ncbi:hypothetical protein HY024_03330 [Candidatus Curtissbacteria bacterium]|nr:hypothetical protein [Candidatus Curtissbacteria bacterium]
MAARNFHHHFVPHVHDGEQHQAHALSHFALFVYLQLVIFAGLLFLTVHIGPPKILGAVNFSAKQIIDLTNDKRKENGLGQLTENQNLDKAAEAKARDMFANDYWAHYSPQGKSPWDFINASGYKYVFAGENLARDFDDAKSVVDAWMNSPSHRSNLLDHNFREIGVAIEDGKLGGREGILVVQMFGSNKVTPAEVASPPEKTPVQETVNPNPKILPANNFAYAKYTMFGILAAVFLLFVTELVAAMRKENIVLRGQIVAHILLLGFVLMVLWYSASGAII